MRHPTLAGLLSALVLSAGAAHADVTIEVESSFSGGIWDGGITAPGFMNYFVGYSFPSTPVERRNYFIFDLTTLTDPALFVTGARLKLFLPGGPSLPSGYVSSDPTETYRVSGSPAPWTAFYDAFTGAATPAMLTAMFGTMGALGPTTYGVTVVSADDSGTDVVIELAPGAVADINAVLGAHFLITGRLTDLHPDAPGTPPSELVFAYTDIPHPLMPLPRLELDVVPAPAGLLTLAPGLLLAGRRRRA